jgi:crotonobetainyl-CoA:carnitine CoA-transferase CaiB-like acyl-CoA transferase
LARARGVAVTNVESSLMMTATVFQSEQVAHIAMYGHCADEVGENLEGPAPMRHLYRAVDGWLTVYAVTSEQQASLCAALHIDTPSIPTIAQAIGTMTVEIACARLSVVGVPVAVSIHPSAISDDRQVQHQNLLTTVRHSVAGPFVQVGIPLRLSVDSPAVKGPAPAPVRGRRREGQRA